jgi:dUTP pyrophosphatase
MDLFALNLPVKQLPHGSDLPLPQYATTGAAGMDLYAAVESNVVIAPSEWQLVPTGIAVALPSGFEAQIRPRSGLAFKHGITVLNAPGTIDNDYRGEIKVMLMNFSKQPFTIERGMRIAQIVISAITQMDLLVVDELPESVRGEGGFGSTGV